LQSVTSIPAKSLQQDHRIGYIKTGYDADIVVWDSHPLSVGATPLQVYVDGKPTLDPEKVKDSMPSQYLESRPFSKPGIRPLPLEEARTATCSQISKHQGPILVTGITASYLPGFEHSSQNGNNLTAIIQNGNLVCLDTASTCQSISKDARVVHLDNGHLSHGLTAITSSLGILEISSESSTTDGSGTRAEDPLDASKVNYAKYGVHLDGKAFGRARIGGVTRAVTLPQYDGGLIRGVSAGIRTSGKKSLLDGGVWDEEVGLHVVVGQGSKGELSVQQICS
jgi:Amidohydrolase family